MRFGFGLGLFQSQLVGVELEERLTGFDGIAGLFENFADVAIERRGNGSPIHGGKREGSGDVVHGANVGPGEPGYDGGDVEEIGKE